MAPKYDLVDVGSPRAERLAKNEALFRAANERMASWEEQHEPKPWQPTDADELRETYYCECADPECQDQISLTKFDYERVRSSSRQFVIVPGHEVPDVETVVETHAGWAIIEKNLDVADTVAATDPRRHG